MDTPTEPHGAYHFIDWSKVKTLNDMKVIFTAIGFYFVKGTPSYELVKKYLTTKED